MASLRSLGSHGEEGGMWGFVDEQRLRGVRLVLSRRLRRVNFSTVLLSPRADEGSSEER
jgi:hypothetical protein